LPGIDVSSSSFGVLDAEELESDGSVEAEMDGDAEVDALAVSCGLSPPSDLLLVDSPPLESKSGR
jgi:hypothetical protein